MSPRDHFMRWIKKCLLCPTSFISKIFCPEALHQALRSGSLQGWALETSRISPTDISLIFWFERITGIPMPQVPNSMKASALIFTPVYFIYINSEISASAANSKKLAAPPSSTPSMKSSVLKPNTSMVI